MTDEPSFTFANVEICNHCTYVRFAPNRDGVDLYCARDNGGIGLPGLGPEPINGLKGCDQFEASGLPAHPKNIEYMLHNNPLASTIPSDPNALETSWAFYEKQKKFLPREYFDYHPLPIR